MRSSPFSLLDADWLTAQPYAHRGLHSSGAPENSRAAFAAAIARGHGIELDVQASRGGFPFVFHDETLDRLTDEHGPVGAREAEDVERIRLKGSSETIPSLDDVLQLVAGRVPILIEVKARGPAWHRLCYGVAGSLLRYSGPAAVMSFDPRVGAWFARHHPATVRGLVVTAQGKARSRGWAERLYSVWRATPQFVASDIRDLPSRFAARLRARGMPVLTWTCRGEGDRATAALYADQIIYEDR
jgi:glycerophosphoryl diester phosphodiesterase